FAGVAGVANAEPQAAEIATVTQGADDVPEAVVAAVTTTDFQAGDARSQVEFVMGHQDFPRGNGKKIGHRRHGLAAAVHISGGDQQTQLVTIDADLAGQAMKLFFFPEGATLAAGQGGNKIGPGIVTGPVVLRAGVSQPDYQFNRGVQWRGLGGAGRKELLRAGLLGFFFSHAAGLDDAGHRQVVVGTVAQVHTLDTCGQRDIGNMHDASELNIGQIDFNELRQILGQTLNIQLGDGVGDDTTGLDTLGALFIDKMKGNLGVQLLSSIHPLEVHVKQGGLGGVTLDVLEDDLLTAHALDIDGDDVAVEGLIGQRLDHVVVQQADILRVFLAAIDDGGNLTGQTTKAAARTFPHIVTDHGINSEIDHESDSCLVCQYPRPE